MASSRTALIERGRRRAQALRPARFYYGSAINVACNIGNRSFDEQLSPDGGGFVKSETMQVHLVRADLPETFSFKKGMDCTVIDGETGEEHFFKIGDDNSSQAAVIILNLTTMNG